jgi:hypothetical protein
MLKPSSHRTPSLIFVIAVTFGFMLSARAPAANYDGVVAGSPRSSVQAHIPSGARRGDHVTIEIRGLQVFCADGSSIEVDPAPIRLRIYRQGHFEGERYKETTTKRDYLEVAGELRDSGIVRGTLIYYSDSDPGGNDLPTCTTTGDDNWRAKKDGV